MIWSPGHKQWYGNSQKEWKHSWIHCRGRLVLRVLREAKLPVNKPFMPKGSFDFDRHLLALHQEMTGIQKADLKIACNLFENGLRCLARTVRETGSDSRTSANLLELKTYLDVNYERPADLPGLARRAHYSIPHLCSLFRTHFGVPAMRYLIQVRLHQAACLLQDRTLSVKEVAQRVGYQDFFHFSKAFKAHHGISPKNFQDRQKKRALRNVLK